MAIPKLHPVVKTARELRRSIDRISVHQLSNPDDQFVTPLLDNLRRAYDTIPETYKEQNQKEE